MRKKIVLNVTNIIETILVFLIILTSHTYTYSNLIKFFLIFMSVFNLIMCLILTKTNNIKTLKLFFIINILFTVIFIVFHILKVNNLLYIFESVSQFKSFILSTKEKGIIVYILIQMAQVIFLPVPASIIAIAGALIYGPLLGALYCTLGVLLGSYVSFFLGRTLGFKLVSWIAGKENAIKYTKVLNDSGKLFLGIAFLLPMFPDDILCLIAGITNMNFKYFLAITTIFRPIGVICMCFFGGGYIIPFSGWGIPIWIIIGIIMLFAVIAIYKNQKKIESWVITKFSRKKKRT